MGSTFDTSRNPFKSYKGTKLLNSSDFPTVYFVKNRSLNKCLMPAWRVQPLASLSYKRRLFMASCITNRRKRESYIGSVGQNLN